MRNVVWAGLGTFSGWRAWRLAHRDIHRLRADELTFGTAFIAHLKFAPALWALCGAALWWLFSIRFSVDATVLVFGLWSGVLLRLLLIDIDTHVLPRRTIGIAATWGLLSLLVLSLFDDAGNVWGMLGGAAVMWLLLKFLEIVSRGDLGGGDVALGPLIGLFVGWISVQRIFEALIAAFILGGVFAIVLVTLGRAGRRTFIAFGPFLIVGALIGVLR